MSNNQPESNKSEEIDLGQVFSYIEKLFIKIGELLKAIFKSVLWLLNKAIVFVMFAFNVFAKNFIIVAIAGILGYSIVFFMNKTEKPTYFSNMLINQNFITGKVLYTNIGNLNALAENRDSISLGKLLKIEPSVASQLKGFNISHRSNKNKILEDYYNFKKLDSTIKLSLDDYILQEDLEDYPFQNITVYSRSPEVYEGLSEKILSSITKNSYFNAIKRKDSIYLTEQIQTIKANLEKSDSLKNSYVDLLKKYYGQTQGDDPKNTTINLSLANNKEKINTKEFDLLEKQNLFRKQLTELKNELRNKSEIIDLLKDFSPASLKKSELEGKAVWLALILILITLGVLILKELKLKDYIRKNGNKEKLFGK